MKKIKLLMLVTVVLATTTSCASLFEGTEGQCDEDRTAPNKCDFFEVHSDSYCE